MRPWRKLHSSILESEKFMDVSTQAKLLFMLLVVAQDDTGYFPWERMKVRRLIACCAWSEEQALSYAEALVEGDMALWEDGGIILRKGEELNGVLRGDRHTFYYQRLTSGEPVEHQWSTTDIPLTDERERGRRDREGEGEPPIVPLKRGMTQDHLEMFKMFWSEYPKKLAKGAAEKAWLKIKPSSELCADILRSVSQAKLSRQWVETPQFIPHPATWLNQRRWEDELIDYGGSNGTARRGDQPSGDPTAKFKRQNAERGIAAGT